MTGLFKESNLNGDAEVTDLMNRLKRSDIYSKVKTSANSVEKNVREFVQERPVTFFFGAVAVGYLTALILIRKKQSVGKRTQRYLQPIAGALIATLIGPAKSKLSEMVRNHSEVPQDLH